MIWKNYVLDYLLTTHRSQQTWYFQSAKQRVQKFTLIIEKKTFKVVYTYFQLIWNFLEWDTEKMLGIKSEAIHSVWLRRVSKLVYYRSSNLGVLRSTTEQHPKCWKARGPTETGRFTGHLPCIPYSAGTRQTPENCVLKGRRATSRGLVPFSERGKGQAEKNKTHMCSFKGRGKGS